MKSVTVERCTVLNSHGRRSSPVGAGAHGSNAGEAEHPRAVEVTG